ncbi:hypothetical protein [Glycomyces harbinensis]|uniref:DUF4439 domain-containing protein n=1 Tax=Glycomyces harbinensis TaxID=58114 RepID=A0A1G6SW16_9ACTN|nr:hypothetical protein [Glycomyces harbinensis]SDD20989.1 hypothetical protein SAMN05216270_102329 [Glycomyces harbinensis]
MFTTRRGLLIGAVALAAAGCTRETAQIITSDADLTTALNTARWLAAAADALDFGDLAEDHRAHVTTLERLLRPNVVPVVEDLGQLPADDAALAEAEATGSRQAADACLATESDFAVVLGEIAASRAAHAAVLA